MNAEMEKALSNQDEEETKEIIIERVTIRESKRAKRPAEILYEIVEDPIDKPEESE
jgi:hypothetical protein